MLTIDVLVDQYAMSHSQVRRCGNALIAEPLSLEFLSFHDLCCTACEMGERLIRYGADERDCISGCVDLFSVQDRQLRKSLG